MAGHLDGDARREDIDVRLTAYLSHVFASAIVRRCAYVLVAFVALHACTARADDHATISDAYAHANSGQADAASYCTNYVNHPLASYYVLDKGKVSATRAAFWTYWWCETQTPDQYRSEHTYPLAQMCPVGTTWDQESGQCVNPCLQKPALSGGWSLDGTQVCSDSCSYSPSGGSAIQKIDGLTYFSTEGWAPSGSCDVSTGASPPPDTDGDGVSDGNDGSPSNPGSTGGGGEDGDGDGRGDGPDGDGDGSPDCGVTGKPACDDGTNPNEHTSTGGQTCGTPPASSGDPILAQIAYQTWATRCAITGKGNAGPGDGAKVDLTPVKTGLDNVANGILATNGILSEMNGKLSNLKPDVSINGGGDCNAPPICSEGSEGQCHIDNQLWLNRCSGSDVVSALNLEAKQAVIDQEASWDAETNTYGDPFSDYLDAVEKLRVGAAAVVENDDGQGDAAALDASGFLSDRTCPDTKIATIRGTEIRMPFTNFCNILGWLGYLILGGAYFKAAKIIAG